MGRRSGGMTGRTDRIIHSGRLPERRNASIRRSRLIAFLRRWPDVVRTSLCRLLGELVQLHALDQLADGLGAHAGGEEPRAATDARAVLAVQLAEVEAVERGLGQHHARLDALDLVARLADVVLGALGLALEALALGLERRRRAAAERPRAAARTDCLLGRLALLDLLR